MPELKKEDISKCHTKSHNHKYFTCDKCNRDFEIREESKLNVCFNCCLFLCDNCVEEHFLMKCEHYFCDGCDRIFDDENDLITIGKGLSSSQLCCVCYEQYKKELKSTNTI